MRSILLLLGTVLLGCTPQIVIGGVGRGECPVTESTETAKWQEAISQRVNEHETRLGELEKLFAK